MILFIKSIFSSNPLSINNKYDRCLDLRREQEIDQVAQGVIQSVPGRVEGSPSLLVAQKRDSDGLTEDEHALFRVAKTGGSSDQVRALAEKGTDFSVREKFVGNTPLLWALANGHNGTAYDMIDFCTTEVLQAQDTSYRNNALHLVVGKGYVTETSTGVPVRDPCHTVARKLLERGVEASAQNKWGNTPLHLACLRRDERMIRVLLEQPGTSLDSPQNKEGKTPRDLLQEDYEVAYAILEQTVFAFTLSPDQHARHIEFDAYRD